MAATIKIKNSSTTGAVPTSSDLVQGELAVNVTDKRIFTENSGGTVVELGTNPSSITLPAGSASAPTLLASGDTNTGLFFPAADTVGITTGGTERLRVDSSGNLGLGVTPSSWATYTSVLQSGRGSFTGTAAQSTLTYNAYYNSGWKYVGTGDYAQLYEMNNTSGAHTWKIAGTGTAGNAITFTQAMTLDASGNLLVGTTSATYSASGRGLVEINGSSTSLMALKTGGSAAGYVYHDGTEMSVVNTKAGSLQLSTNGSERARIDSSGKLLVGVTSSSGYLDGAVNAYGASTAAYCGRTDAGSGTYVATYWNTATSGNNSFQVFVTEAAATVRGSITYNRGAGLTAYNTTSDYRAKDISGPVVNSGALIDSVPVYMGKMKGATQERPMFIAHETPEYAHTGEKDAVDENGNPIYQQMDASSLVPVLWAEVQSLRQRLAAAGI